MGQKKYVKPPRKESNRITLKEIYANLHPDYWKRKLPHLLIIIPVVWLIYISLLLSLFSDTLNRFAIVAPVLLIILLLISIILTLINAIFYPYSLYWYKGSFVGRFLNNMIFFGGLLSVILRIFITLLGGVIIAGVFSPIAGVLTWLKYKNKDIIIGEERDFN